MNLRKITALIVSLVLALGIVTVPATFAETINTNDRTALYNEYVNIVEAVAEETDILIEILPMDEFTEDDWISTDEFEKRVRSIANAKITVENGESGISVLSAVGASKTVTISTEGGASAKIQINGSFNTQYLESAKRQFFSGINSITSSKISGSGTWSQIGYEYTVIDGGRTYNVIVSGNYTVSGVKYTKLLSVEFYCSAVGRAS
jgi:hypothetical protein